MGAPNALHHLRGCPEGAGPRRIILDLTQEQMAKKADPGHTIVGVCAQAHPDCCILNY